VASQVQIVNRALSRIGRGRIVTMGDDTPAAHAATDAWDMCRDEVLRDHPWNSATVRASIPEIAGKAIISVSTANPAVVASTGHAFIARQRIRIDGVVTATELNGKFFRVSPNNLNVNDFELQTEEFENYDGVNAGTGGTATAIPDSELSYFCPQPTDMIRLLEIIGDTNDEEAYAVENGNILTNIVPPLPIRYIKRETDTAKYEPLLASLIAARLAVEFLEGLTGVPDLRRQQITQWYELLNARAKNADGQETYAAPFEEDEYISVRA
jgi:hypothetical protein